MDYLKKGLRVHALLKVHAHIADYKKKNRSVYVRFINRFQIFDHIYCGKIIQNFKRLIDFIPTPTHERIYSYKWNFKFNMKSNTGRHTKMSHFIFTHWTIGRV